MIARQELAKMLGGSRGKNKRGGGNRRALGASDFRYVGVTSSNHSLQQIGYPIGRANNSAVASK